MVRSELVEKIAAANPGLSLRDVDNVVTALFDKMSTQLAQGGRVELRGFGIFSTRARNPRDGRNPRTGRIVPVEAKRVPHFKAGKEIRDRLIG